MLEIGLRVGATKPTQKKGVLSCWLSHWGRVLAQGSPCPVPQGLGGILFFWGPPGSCDSGKGCQGAWGICGSPELGGFSLCSAPSQHLECDQLDLGSSAAALSLGGVAGDPLSRGMALERGDPDVLGFPEGTTAFS